MDTLPYCIAYRQGLYLDGYRQAMRDMSTGDGKVSVTGQYNPSYYGVGYRQAMADRKQGIRLVA